MMFNEFKQEVKREIGRMLEIEKITNVNIEEVEVIKVNDQKLTGICIRPHGENAGPTIYIDEMYKEYEKGKVGIAECANNVFTIFKESANIHLAVDDETLSWENVKDRLFIRLLGKEKNTNFLKTVPYKDVGNGLVLICYICLNPESDDKFTANVTTDILRSLKVTENELFDTAMRNIENDSPILTSMEKAMFGNMVNYLEDDQAVNRMEPMYILTTESQLFGAAALFYPGIQERVSKIMGSSYYALPSSQHEFILVPDSEEYDEKALLNMVKEANKTVVAPNEILTDDVYHFIQPEKRLVKVN